MIFCAGCAASASAQTAPSASPAPGAPPSASAPSGTSASSLSSAENGRVTKLEKYTVSDVPIEDQVLPTVRPISSVMGDDRSIIDIPRSVTSVNQAWMNDREVKNAMDFGQFSPGVYSVAAYGIPAVPFIRGDLAQVYMDGQMMPFDHNNIPTSFNAVEAVDIVKGPGSAVYGPQGEGTGGYVNYVTKEPYFDGNHTDITTILDAWTSGHSYFNPQITIDTGGPISNDLAYRVSYLSRFGDGYYLNNYNRSEDVYAALSYRPSASFKLDWWIQGFVDQTTEIGGTNRVTQAFIWNGTYVKGPAVPQYGDDTIPVGSTVPTVSSGIYSVIQPTGTTILPPYDAIVSPHDVADSGLVVSQLTATVALSPDTTFIDRLFFSNGESHKFDYYGYDEYMPLQQSIQDRAEYHTSWTWGPIAEKLIAGVDLRYSRLLAYTDYSNEPFSIYDLSQPLSQIAYPAYTAANNTFGGIYRVPGTGTYSAFDAPDDQDSHIYDAAAFVQDDISLTKWASLLAGYRLDYIKADDQSPSFYQVGEYNADYQLVALQTPVYVPQGADYAASDHVVDPSYFVNLVFKLSESQSFYLTYDHVDAILGVSEWGGVSVSSSVPATADAQLNTSLTAKSTLYEAGYKQSFLNNTLYVGAAVFQQEKLGTQLGGADYLIKDNGAELEVVYQPNKTLAINANVTYQAATAFAPSGSGFYQQTGSYLDAYPTNYVVPGSDGQYGTGLGSPNFTTYYPPNGRIRAPGIPQMMANFFVEYKFLGHYGVGVGPQITGREYANDEDTLHIPGEYSLDGYVFYQRKHWDVRVNLNNITDQRLIDPIDVTFAGNDLVFVRQPISASLTFRLHY
jgi:outer membrane receptor protein involved in Fe transport